MTTKVKLVLKTISTRGVSWTPINQLKEGDWFVSSAGHFGVVILGCTFYPRWVYDNMFYRSTRQVSGLRGGSKVQVIPKVIISERGF